MYLDNVGIVDCLTDEQAGKLWKMLFVYAVNGEAPNIDDTIVKMGFNVMSKQIDRDKIKYIEKCEKNRKNINKRWNNSSTDEYESIQTNTDEYDGIQTNTNYTNNNTISTTAQPSIISTSTIPQKSNINEQEQRKKEEKRGTGKKEEKTKNDIFISLPTSEGNFDITYAMYEEYQRQYPSNDVSMILHKLKVHCQLNSIPRANIEDLIAQRLWEGT